MKRDKKIEALIATAGRVAECRDKRGAWVRETAAAARAAQREMDERCMDAVDKLSEEEFERLCEEEDAKVEAFRGPLKDAAERDVWPRPLYVSGI
jgi:hypothetical protein